MEKSSNTMMEDFGGRVASVWEGLRPATRHLVENALHSSPPAAAAGGAHAVTTGGRGIAYDTRAEWELSRLLAALDERAREGGARTLSVEQTRDLSRLTETCASVLHVEARSAEVFGQLLERAVRARAYARIDVLADTISARLAPTEMCELARYADPSVRAVAREALAQAPTGVLVELLGDPVDADVARDALEAQAAEFGSAEARWIVNALDRADEDEI